MKTLFKNAMIITMDSEKPFVNCGFVAVDGSKIAYVGEIRPDGSFDREVDAAKKLLMPGLINTHTHIPMTLFRGLSDDCELKTWLFEYIFPAEDKLTDEKVRAGTSLALCEMLASGTTSFSDGYFFTDTICEVTVSSGMKANLSRSIAGDGENFEKLPAVAEMKRLVKKLSEEGEGRVLADASIHAEYTTSPKCRLAVAEFAKENNLILQIHTSESESEHKDCIEKYGKTPTTLFESEGLFEGTRPLLAHCCHITEEDMDIIKAANGSIAHCPLSNLKLASGVAPALTMMKRGLNVSLGTDGVASNNSTDMFEEIKLFATLHKGVSGDPTAVSAYQALCAATVNAAKAQGREDCGMLKSGLDADMIMLDFDRPHLVPCHNAVSNTVYSARGSDVVMTMVRGRILYENGEYKTLDVERAMYDVSRIK